MRTKMQTLGIVVLAGRGTITHPGATAIVAEMPEPAALWAGSRGRSSSGSRHDGRTDGIEGGTRATPKHPHPLGTDEVFLCLQRLCAEVWPTSNSGGGA